jgi:outer membrane PBP1 activator LpoA protein
MSVTIKIDTPKLLPQLLASLIAAGCLTQRVSSHACRVVHPPDVDPDTLLRELRFYARAWALRHGDVAVCVSSDT